MLLSVLDTTHLIPFKAKAYLDLKGRKELGEQIDSKKIRKHRNDVLRLSQLLTGNESVQLPESIKAGMRAFLDNCESERIDLRQIGVVAIPIRDILDALRGIYRL